jgi:hypothetical protein
MNAYLANTMARDHVDELVATATDARRAREARLAGLVRLTARRARSK